MMNMSRTAAGWHLHPDDMEQDAQALGKTKGNQQVVMTCGRIPRRKSAMGCVYSHPVWDEKQDQLIK
jgi:hypothetical protein